MSSFIPSAETLAPLKNCLPHLVRPEKILRPPFDYRNCNFFGLMKSCLVSLCIFTIAYSLAFRFNCFNWPPSTHLEESLAPLPPSLKNSLPPPPMRR